MAWPPTTLIISHAGVSPERRQRESKGIRDATEHSTHATRIIETSFSSLPAVLRDVLAHPVTAPANGDSVWLHQMGLPCPAMSVSSNTAGDSTLHSTNAHDQDIIPSDVTAVTEEQSVHTDDGSTVSCGDFISLITRFSHGLELVFCNAPCTKTLADALPVRYKFGCATSLSEDVAVVFSNLFYNTMAKGLSIEDAFILASQATMNCPPREDRQAEIAAAPYAPSAAFANPPDNPCADVSCAQRANALICPNERNQSTTIQYTAAKRRRLDPSAHALTVRCDNPTVVCDDDGGDQMRTCASNAVNKASGESKARVPARAKTCGDRHPKSNNIGKHQQDAQQLDTTPIEIPALPSILSTPHNTSRTCRSWLALARYRCMETGEGTPLRPSTLVGIGEAKINKLAKLGVSPLYRHDLSVCADH